LNGQGRSPTHKDRELVGYKVGYRPTDIISKLIIRRLITCPTLIICLSVILLVVIIVIVR
jgi:hypothetical protein